MLRQKINCLHCGAIKFEFEPPGFCCSSGQIQLSTQEPPTALCDLIFGPGAESENFRHYIRIYNSSFAFTSMGIHLDEKLMQQNAGIYTFRVQGQVHHWIKPLDTHGNTASALQLYFHDTDHEIQNRQQFSNNLKFEVIQRISNFMALNPYSKFFKSLTDFSNLREFSICIKSNPALDQRVYNSPSVSQVAAMWVDNGTNDEWNRDIIVHGWDDRTHSIRYDYGCYDPLQYPILFPYGEIGWHPNIARNNTIDLTIPSTANLATSVEEFLQTERRGTFFPLLYYN